MSFDSLLIHTCDIELKTDTQDAAGQMIASWAVALNDAKCRIEPVGGGRSDLPEKIFQETTHTLYMRKPAAVTIAIENHRIDVGGVKYTILLVREINKSGGVSHLELFLKYTD